MRTKLDYFNPNGVDPLSESLLKINAEELGTKGRGFCNFNKPKYQFSKTRWDHMLSLTWFPSQVNTATEKKSFDLLTEQEQDVYKTTFAQLSFLDSIQGDYILDFRQHVNNRIVKATLTRQAWEEELHSDSYAVLLDAAGNSEEVFDAYKTDDLLLNKNNAVAEQFAMNINGTTAEKLLLSAVASISLEGIYFLTGFGMIHTIGDKVQGARGMINEISMDELQSHAPFFRSIFKTIVDENKFNTKTMDSVIKMIEDASKIELEYSLGLIERSPILGVTSELLEVTVKNFTNDRLEAIGLPTIYDDVYKTQLQKMVERGAKEGNFVKGNFFETNISAYSKGTLDLDDF